MEAKRGRFGKNLEDLFFQLGGFLASMLKGFELKGLGFVLDGFCFARQVGAS